MQCAYLLACKSARKPVWQISWPSTTIPTNQTQNISVIVNYCSWCFYSIGFKWVVKLNSRFHFRYSIFKKYVLTQILNVYSGYSPVINLHNVDKTYWIVISRLIRKGNRVHEIKTKQYRHSSISVVSISAIFNLPWFIILSYFPPL